MKRAGFIIAITFLLFSILLAQTNHIVISELATRGPSSASDEFVEIYNPTTNDIDISGWKLEYKSQTGTSWITKFTVPNGTILLFHHYFLFASGSSFYSGPTPADLQLSASTAIGMSDNSHIHLVNASNQEVDKVGYGTGVVDPEGSAAPNHGTTANNNSVERKARASSTADSLAAGGLHVLSGNGYDTNNNSTDFVAQTHGRNPQNSPSSPEPPEADGSGTATIKPDTLDAGTTTNIIITYRRNPTLTITDLRIIVPSPFSWSHSFSDIMFTNMTADTSISGDTIYFNNVTLTADSNVITIQNVTPPDSTAFYPFNTQTKGVSQYRNVSPIPKITVFGVPVPIADIKINDANGAPLKLGQLVTIEGIITVANEFGSPSYVQDNSGAMAIFGSSFSTAVNIGDEVKVSGVVNPFNGLSELTSPYLHSKVILGNSVSPTVVTCSQLFNDGAGGVEQYEALLVRLNVVTVTDTFGNPITNWTVSGSGTNYRLHDATGYVDTRVDNNVNFANTPAPQGTFNVIGVVGQFKTSSPYIGGYQLMPRSASDILSVGPIIATSPVESNIQTTSITINWTTVNPGTTRLRYGTTTSYELGVVGTDTSRSTSHVLDLSGLTPAMVYNVQAFSVSGTDTSIAANFVVSTSSPPASTGQINVYFNRSVNTSVSTGELALGNQDLVSRILTRINNAHRSIDAAIHSLSSSPGDAVASALVNAKNRGVKVRVICEYDNRNTNAFNTIAANGIPLIDDRFDPINFGAGLMHNKFFVFDYHGGAPESVWVWTGSWNLTAQQTTTDHQNSIEIQDVSLAGAYTLEFNEMWGSDTDTPNASSSRFGARKRDNTPHKFVINSLPIESYFSPSDQTTKHIKNTLRLAEQDIAFALYSFTRSDIADTLIARKNAGKKVRGDMESSSSSEQFTYLQTNGIDVHLDPFSSLLHHKYAIVDATKGSQGPQWVITGSHNWSNNAENSNNENTLIIQSPRVANLYLQEFAARYYEAGGIDPIVLAVQEIGGVPQTFSLSQNYPNPFNPSTVMYYELPVAGKVSLVVYNLLGQEVTTLVNEEQKVGRYRVEFSAPHLASGVYFYRLRAGSFSGVKKMVLIK